MSRQLIKSTAVVSVLTLGSRVSGLVRDVVFASFIGAGVQTDAFFVAFRIPNLFRRFFGEGALTAAFVPVFAEFPPGERDPEARRFVAYTSGFLSMTLLVITVLGVVFAPAVVSAIAPGFRSDAVRFDLTVDALRLTFPYLVCISLVAMAAGVLNSRDRFAVPALTPVFLNLCLIAAAAGFAPRSDDPALVLALAVLVAGLVQLGFQLPYLRREAMLVRPRVAGLRKSGAFEPVVRVLKLMGPVLIGASASQINVFINTLLASFLVAGSVSWLYYADRLLEFPLALFGVAVGTVILPSLSRDHARVDESGFSRTLNWGLVLVLAIALPAASGLFVLGTPLIVTLLQYGQFAASDAFMAAAALKAYAAGLVGMMCVKVLTPAYFSRKDTATPVKIGVFSIVVNIALSLALIGPFKHVGLAAATAAGALVNALLLYLVLRRRGIFRPEPGFGATALKVLAATAAMAVLLALVSPPDAEWPGFGFWQRICRLISLIAAGIIVYVAVLFLLGTRPRTFIRPSRQD